MKYFLISLIVFFIVSSSSIVLARDHFVGTSNMISLVNQDRQTNHMQPLIENKLLDASAQAKAEDMCQKHYFAHWNPQGKSPWQFMREVGYNFIYAGENLAKGYTEQEAEQSFMKSPSHKANIVSSNYTEVGIGECNQYIVEHFGRR